MRKKNALLITIIIIIVLITGCTNVTKKIDNNNQFSNFRENWDNIINDKEEFNNSQLIDVNVGVFNIRISSNLEEVLKFRFEFVAKNNNTYNLYEYNQDKSKYNLTLREKIKESYIDTGLTVTDSMDIFDSIDMQLISSLFKEKGEFFEISFQGLYTDDDYITDIQNNNIQSFLYDNSTIVPISDKDVLSNDTTLIKCLVSNYHAENNNYTSIEDIILYIKK